jgi:hypothetical protein
MTETEKTNFSATYFDKDSVLHLNRLAEIFSWGMLIYHVALASMSMLVFVLQTARHLFVLNGLVDYIHQSIWMFQPIIPGVMYFIAIQALGKFLLIMMDIEDNLRRAVRTK